MLLTLVIIFIILVAVLTFLWVFRGEGLVCWGVRAFSEYVFPSTLQGVQPESTPPAYPPGQTPPPSYDSLFANKGNTREP